MPKIPIYQDELLGVPPPQFNSYATASSNGGSLARLGDAISGVGQVVATIEAEERDKANRAILMDAENRMDVSIIRRAHDPEIGYSRLKGKEVLERPSGKSFIDEQLEIFDSDMKGISESLKNADVKEAFRLGVEKKRAATEERLMGFQNQNADQYAVDSAVARRGLAMDAIAQNYNKPSVVMQSVASLNEAISVEAQVMGHSPEWIDMASKKAASNAYAMGIKAALTNRDVSVAQASFSQHSGHMLADDLVEMKKLLTVAVDTQVASTAAHEVLTRLQPRIDPSETDKLFNSMMVVESGNRQLNADGTPVTSPAGAIGIAQIMKETGPEAAKLAGLPWDERKFKYDAEYNEKLGRTYFNHQLEYFRGDEKKAVAAYNAGAGRVNESIKKAEDWNAKNQSPGSEPKTWVDFLPEETKKYIPRVLNGYRSGLGKPDPVTAASLRVEIQRDPSVFGSPERLALAQKRGEELLTEYQANLKQNDAQNFSRAVSLMNSGVTFDKLPVDLQAANSDRRDDLMRYEKAIKGDVVTDPALYNDAINNVKALAAMPDAEFVAHWTTKVDSATFKQLAKMRASYIEGKTGNPEVPRVDELNREIESQFVALGIQNTKSGRKQKGLIKQAVINEVIDQQKALGRQLSGDDLDKFVHGLFLKSTAVKGFLGGETTERTLTLGKGDIPKETIGNIRKKLKTTGITSATDEEILLEYWNQNL